MTEEELKALIAKAVAEELERRAKPKAPFKSDLPPPPNRIDLLSMPPQAMADMLRAVPDAVMRDIAGDARRQSTLSPLGGEPTARPRGTGWSTAQPLTNPPGVALADKIVDAQDAAERVELAQRLTNNTFAERLDRAINRTEAAQRFTKLIELSAAKADGDE